MISSILVKQSIRLSAMIRRVNDRLQELCSMNGFTFISNDFIGREWLSEDGIHLNDEGVYMLASNFVKILNSLHFTKSK